MSSHGASFCNSIDDAATRTVFVRSRIHVRIFTLVASGVLLLFLTNTIDAPAASADACPDIQVVFARGTDEAPGVGRVGQAFADALRADVKGKSIVAYAVNYPASRDFLRATEGANDASAFIQGVAAACPNTKMVLGGYSQGAAVIDVVTVAAQPVFGFNNPLPADLASHVAAVAVFGNPSNRIGGPLTTLSPLYGSKTTDLCNGADPVCSDGNDVSAHSLYVQTGMASEAARFAAALV
jgi:cutinase